MRNLQPRILGILIGIYQKRSGPLTEKSPVKSELGGDFQSPSPSGDRLTPEHRAISDRDSTLPFQKTNIIHNKIASIARMQGFSLAMVPALGCGEVFAIDHATQYVIQEILAQATDALAIGKLGENARAVGLRR